MAVQVRPTRSEPEPNTGLRGRRGDEANVGVFQSGLGALLLHFSSRIYVCNLDLTCQIGGNPACNREESIYVWCSPRL